MRTVTTLDADDIGFTILSLGVLGFEFRIYLKRGFNISVRIADFLGLGRHHNE